MSARSFTIGAFFFSVLSSPRCRLLRNQPLLLSLSDPRRLGTCCPSSPAPSRTIFFFYGNDIQAPLSWASPLMKVLICCQEVSHYASLKHFIHIYSGCDEWGHVTRSLVAIYLDKGEDGMFFTSNLTEKYHNHSWQLTNINKQRRTQFS